MAEVRLTKLKDVLLCCLSGGMLTAGFPLLQLPGITWLALVPMFFALRGKNRNQAFYLGYIVGLVHYLTTLYWIRNVIHQYGNLPLVLAYLVLVLLCGYLALYPACFALLANHLENHPRLWVWVLPAGWVCLEWIRAYAVTGFPWANLGYTQSSFLHLIQVADITGVFGVSWLLVLANTCIGRCLIERRLHWNLLVFAACGALFVFYGSQRLQTIEQMQERADLWRVGVIQGNIDQAQKWDPAYQQETLKRYHELSLTAADSLPTPDLLVWPETATPFFYGFDRGLTQELQEIIREFGVPLLFGSPGVGMVAGKPRLFNKAYLVDINGDLLGDYAKQHLVPFGEYVPLQKLLFFVHRLVEAAGDFAAGENQQPLVFKHHRLGVLICYEAIFPDLARSAVKNGATALFNLTNDAWFGNTSAPYQHLEMARWRAIEFRVPLVRCANTGISATFEASGRQKGLLPLNEAGFLISEVHPLQVQTFYAAWGDVFAWLCVLVTVVGLGLTIHRRER